ncbi:MAG: carbon-nitrogen hydrolase family protein [Deltaproteobacteria bacterium]|nr:carbon-nitrogen hydrolase family protein [Deltaproteobacteria bacterium]
MTVRLAVAAVQLTATTDVGANLSRAEALCRRAAEAGARLVVLPENFGCFGADADKLPHAQEIEDGPFLTPLRRLAKEQDVYILAGSIPERGPDAAHTYNTSVLIDPAGKTRATYRKIHLFDVELGGGLSYRESEHVTAGSTPVVADVDGFKLGLSICYDLRFPELYRALVQAGARAFAIPAAFTLHTGKDHWEPLLRARAIENLCYVVAAGQWGFHGERRYTWGKSMLVDPWGTPLCTAPEGEGFVTATFDTEPQDRIRAEIPSLANRRL